MERKKFKVCVGLERTIGSCTYVLRTMLSGNTKLEKECVETADILKFARMIESLDRDGAYNYIVETNRTLTPGRRRDPRSISTDASKDITEFYQDAVGAGCDYIFLRSVADVITYKDCWQFLDATAFNDDDPPENPRGAAIYLEYAMVDLANAQADNTRVPCGDPMSEEDALTNERDRLCRSGAELRTKLSDSRSKRMRTLMVGLGIDDLKVLRTELTEKISRMIDDDE